jgi:Transposase DDE domain
MKAPHPLLGSLISKRKRRRKALGLEDTRAFVDNVFRQGLHGARVMALGNAVAGVMRAAGVGIHAIGRAYAALSNIEPRHGIKQVDRLLSSGVSLEDALRCWVQFVVAAHPSIVLAMDWTDFEADDHVTLYVALVTTNGRALPLAWKTVKKSELAGNQSRLEEEMVERLHDWLPKGTRVTLLADRGFGRVELYRLLESLHWDYVIRFKQDVLVDDGQGTSQKARAWVPPNGRVRVVPRARVTGRRIEVPAVVMLKAKRMKEPWCLATSLLELPGQEIVRLYGRRFSVEETFRDTKDLNFGMGLSATHIRRADRRDRLLLLVAVAHSLLSLLGVASERSGMDRGLKANTVKRRTHSLFRQGAIWYDLLPDLSDERVERLLTAFDQVLLEHHSLSQLFAMMGPLSEAAE